MKLEGIVVKHKVFGEGIIKQHEGKYILVTFSKGDKEFIYPDSFKTFITAVDDRINRDIQRDIERNEAEYIAEQKEKVLVSAKTCINNKIKPLNKARKNEIYINDIKPSGKQYFFVFQNKSFNAERRGGYLWAPKANQDGRRVSHWLMMEEVHKGDIIFHSLNKNIKAISIAISDCYSANQPEELKREQMWEDDGYRVDCEYIDIKNPIITSDYMDSILELQPAKYAPFNKLGRGNTGYLFASNKELSQFLLDKLIKINIYLKEYIVELGFDSIEKW